jgi:glutathione-regulated potassium-efflux system ancillary protein KefC
MEILKHTLVPFLIVVAGFLSLELAFPIAIAEFLAGMIGKHFIDYKDIPWIKFFSHLGLLGLMFLAGFEIEIKVLKKNLSKNLKIGFLSYIVPFLSISILCIYAYDFTLKQAAAVSIALSTTSLAIIYTILKKDNNIKKYNGQILLGSAMVIDILSMLSLTFIILEISLYNLFFLITLITFLVFIKKIVIKTFKRYKNNLFEFELKFFLLILLALGILAEKAGLHAAIIAFIAGVLFSDIDPEHEKIIEKLNTIVFSLLAPLFFFHAGFLVELKNFNLKLTYMATILLAVAFFTKYLGTYLSLYFFNNKDITCCKYGSIIFNHRLSFGIVTAMYAYESGVIDEKILSTTLIIVLLLSIISVVFAKKKGFKINV